MVLGGPQNAHACPQALGDGRALTGWSSHGSHGHRQQAAWQGRVVVLGGTGGGAGRWALPEGAGLGGQGAELVPCPTAGADSGEHGGGGGGRVLTRQGGDVALVAGTRVPGGEFQRNCDLIGIRPLQLVEQGQEELGGRRHLQREKADDPRSTQRETERERREKEEASG